MCFQLDYRRRKMQQEMKALHAEDYKDWYFVPKPWWTYRWDNECIWNE